MRSAARLNLVEIAEACWREADACIGVSDSLRIRFRSQPAASRSQSSLEHLIALAYETSHPLPFDSSENHSQTTANVMTTVGITAPVGPITRKPPAINIVYTI